MINWNRRVLYEMVCSAACLNVPECTSLPDLTIAGTRHNLLTGLAEPCSHDH